jgi:hypothetical protein
MKRTVIRIAGILSTVAICSAQLVSNVSLSNGVQLQISTDLGTPTGAQSITVEMLRASGNSFYRIFRDQNQLAVFAYELALDLSAAGDRLTATARPVETKFAALFPNVDAGKPVPTLSSDQRLGPIASGNKADIGLFQMEGLGTSVVDTIRLKIDRGDTTGHIHLAGLKIAINGAPVSSVAPASVAGRFVMFYIPRHGAYFLTTEAVDGTLFVKAGSIDGNQMKFNLDNEQYDVTANSPILKDPASGEVWVYHDPAYKPSGNWTQNLSPGASTHSSEDEFFMAASDSLSWWLGK